MGDISSANIQTAFNAVPTTSTFNATLLAEKIAGTGGGINVIELTNTLNALAKGNSAQKATLVQIVDLMSKEAGGADEYFTKAGLADFRTALKEGKSIVDAFNSAKNKNTIDGVAEADIANVDSSETAIDTHLRSILGVTTSGAAGDVMVGEGTIAYDLAEGVPQKLADSWGVKLDSPEYKQRVFALVLAFKCDTTAINKLVNGGDSKWLDDINPALNRFVKVLNNNQGWFSGTEENNKISEAWANFCSDIGAIEGVGTTNLVGLKNISPKFLVAGAKEATKVQTGTVPAWLINTVFDNGVASTLGMPKKAKLTGGYDKAAYSEALGGFLKVVSKSNSGGFKFYSAAELSEHQNIFNEDSSKVFWKGHAELQAYYKIKYPEIAEKGSKALLDKFIADLWSASIIKIDDTHDFWLKRNEAKMLEAAIEGAAIKIEKTYGTEGTGEIIDKKDGKDVIPIEDIFTKTFATELNTLKTGIYETPKDSLPTEVTNEDVTTQLNLKYHTKPETITKSADRLGKSAGDRSGLFESLKKFYYSSSVLPGNKWFSSTSGEDADKVSNRIAKGIDYLASDKFTTDGTGVDEVTGKDKLTKTQRTELRKAMASAGTGLGPVGAGAAGASSATSTPEQQALMERLSGDRAGGTPAATTE